jgi:hydrogenase expression/formation protein HypE
MTGLTVPAATGADTVVLGHGSGGRLSRELLERVFLPVFDDPELARLADGAIVPAAGEELVVSTDGYVVSPLVFPGGDIGRLAVAGSVNDVAVMGARPLYITLAFVLEEGLPLATLEAVCRSARDTAREAGVRVVAGDTKVVGRGHGDGVFIVSTALGTVTPARRVRPDGVRPGDAVLVSGTMGDHGMTVLTARGEPRLELSLTSDVAPVNGLVEALFQAGVVPHAMRDPTRGGLAGTLNEIAGNAGVAVEIREDAVPVRPETATACELLGLDPLYVANEGKVAAFVASEDADTALRAWRAHPLGAASAGIGTVLENGPPGRVTAVTPVGGRRMLDVMSGDPLPRIC